MILRQTGLYSQGVNPKERILRTASRLFYREGIHAVGIQRLIDEAGVVKASLYAHFPSKDAVVTEYLARTAADFRRAIETSILEAPVPAREKILKLFDYLVAWTASCDFAGCPFQKSTAEFPDREHEVRQAVARQRAWVHQIMTGLAHEVRAPQPQTFAGALIVLFDGAAASSAIDASPTAAAHARWAVEQLLAGIESAPPDPRPRRRRTPR